MAWLHGTAIIKPPTPCFRQKVKNIGNDELPVGAGVIFTNETAGGDHTWVCIRSTAVFDQSVRAAAAGIVCNTYIEPGGTGVIVRSLLAQTVLVTGTVDVGNWLCLKNGHKGLLESTAMRSWIGFAIAKGTNTGSRKVIPAIVTLGRI